MANDKNLKLLQWIFFCSLALTIIYIVSSRQLLQPLTTDEIIAFEKAKTIDRATDIMIDWSMNNKLEKAALSIQLDYLFILLYAVCIFSGCRYLAGLTKTEALIKSSNVFSYLIIFAAVFDIIENLCMQHTLGGKLSKGVISLAYNMASAKFFLVGICLLAIAIYFLALLWNKFFVSRKSQQA